MSNQIRDSRITRVILNGHLCKDVAKSYNISPERIRQIVAEQCKEINPEAYSEMPECKTVIVSWLRRNKTKFL